MPIVIAGRKVLLFKSNFHLARDDKSMPVLDMFKQVIQQTSADLVITTGTAGAIGSKLQLGDVVVANGSRFKLDGSFKSAPFNGKSYSSQYAPKPAGALKIVNGQLVKPNATQLIEDFTDPTYRRDADGLFARGYGSGRRTYRDCDDRRI